MTLAATHVGQWHRLHGRVTDAVWPQRKRDKDWDMKMVRAEWHRVNQEKKKKTVGWAFTAVLIRSKKTSFSSTAHTNTPAPVCDRVIHSFSALSTQLWSPPPLIQSSLPHPLIQIHSLPLSSTTKTASLYWWYILLCIQALFLVHKTEYNPADSTAMHLLYE